MFNDTYRVGNLKVLGMMISQLNNSIDPANPNHGPRTSIIDMDEIEKNLCSTSKLAYLLDTGAGIAQLPKNDEIYTDDFLGSINEYLDTRYKYEFYNDYTLIQIRSDLQRIYDDYNKHGILPWETKKLEDHICDTSEVKNVSDFQAGVNKEEANEEKTLVVKIIKQRTDEEENNMNNSEPSKMKKYQLATENIGEPIPRLYNLHIIEAYDVAGAIREYNRIYIIDDAREQIVVIREVEHWSAVGAIVSRGARSKLDRMKHNATDVTKEDEETETLEKEDVEEMKESIVKGDRTNTTERTPLEIIDHAPIFDIEAIHKGYPYLLETVNDDGSVERKIIVITDISEERIDCTWRDTPHDEIRRADCLSPMSFENGRCKLYPITIEDLK